MSAPGAADERQPVISAQHLDGDRFAVAVRQHRLAVDQPVGTAVMTPRRHRPSCSSRDW
jgi:hypothetical protein